MKKNTIVICIICALIFVIVIFAFIGLRKLKLNNSVKTMFEDIKTGNVDLIGKYINYGQIGKSENAENTENLEETNKQFAILFSDLEYKIVKEKIHSKEAFVEVEVTNRDIKQTLRNSFAIAFSKMLTTLNLGTNEENLEDSYLDSLKNEYDKTNKVANKIQIRFEKVSGKWVVDKSEESSKTILNAILPGYLDYYNE